MYKLFRVFAFLSQMIEFVMIPFQRFHVITQNPVTGRMSGNIANTRFGVWRGINVAASIGLKEQRKPQTMSTAVILNQAKMRLSGKTTGEILSFVKQIFPFKMIGTTEFAETLKYFRKKLTGIFSALLLDYSLMHDTSIGNGYTTNFLFNVSNALASGLVVNCSNVSVTDEHFDPGAEMWLLVVNDKYNKAHLFDVLATINDGTGTVDLTGYFSAADNIMCFVGVNENSTYTGNVLKQSKFFAVPGADFITLI